MVGKPDGYFSRRLESGILKITGGMKKLIIQVNLQYQWLNIWRGDLLFSKIIFKEPTDGV